MDAVKTLARAALAAAVAMLAVQAGPAGAAVQTYYVKPIATVNVGADGSTTMTTLVDITIATPPVPNTNRAMTNTTAPTGTTRYRMRQGAATTATNEEYFRAYTPAYAAATTIAAAATAYADFYLGTTGTTVTASAVLYEYSDATGIVGAAKGTATFNGNAGITTRQTMNNASFGNAVFTVAAGNRLMVVYRFTTAGTRPAYLWGQSASATPSGYQSFTVNESPAVTGTVTMATGTDPAGTTLAPGAAATQVDAFTLQVTSGTSDNVNAVTVNLAGTGNSAGLASLSIQNSATCTQATPYGTDTTVTDGANAITLTTPIGATTTATTYYVCAAPKSHATMPAVPGATHTVTANVSAFTPATYTAAGTDTAPATAFTIDNLSPGDVTGLSVTPGNGQLVVNWTNPASDYARTMVLYRATTAISDVPAEGNASYAAPGTLGASTIAYVGGTAGAAGTTTISGLPNGTLHNVKVFVQDAAGNWSTPGAATSGTPTAPAVPPGAPGTPTYSGVSTGSITVNWTAATGAATYNIDYSTDGSTYLSAATGVATLSYTHGTRTANTHYWYRITAVNVAGSTPGLSSSTWTLTNPVASAPASGTISPASIAVSWTAPTPAATSYLVEWSLTNFGAVAGSTTVTGPTATASGLTQGTPYYFRVTAINGAGVAASPSPVGGPFTTTSGPTLVVGDGTNPGPASICPSPTAPSGATLLDAFTLQATSTDDVVSRITVQLAPAGAWVNVATVEITNAGGTTSYGSAIPGGDLVNVYVTGVSQAVGVTTPYAVRITPRAHAAMPAPNVGQQYAMTGTVTSIASNNPRAYGDTASATVTVDNLAPAEVTWSAVTTGASNIQLDWSAATGVVVLRKQGGPVTDAPVDGASYTAGAALGGSTVACVGTLALCNSPGLAAGTAYSFKVFTRDACGNYSRGAAVGPLFPGGLNEGDALAGTLAPVVAILNPMNPATVTNSGAGFRVQVRAFSRMNGATAQAISAIRLKAATPAQTFVATCNAANFPIALGLNANYPSSTAAGTDHHGVYEATVTVGKGAYTLRACATNASGTVLSGPVGITVNDGSAGSPRGDGNLLVRDNGAQLCGDCHAIATHASESVGSDHGSWYAACRDCHTPHNTTNVELIRTQITPPGYRGPQPPRVVVFSDRSTGYSTTGGASNPSAAAFANADATGICQVCHTQTTYYLSNGTGTGHNPNQRCTDCHSHVKGLKASCTECHGDKTGAYAAIAGADGSVAAAPPTAADKVTSVTSSVKVGAHQAHVNQATYRTNPLACADCHIIPNSHNGTADAAWRVLATTTTIDGVNQVIAPTPGAGTNAYTAAWEATPTCTNACHGANLPSGKTTPAWNSAGGSNCATCHGQAVVAPEPGYPHPQSIGCATCHGTGYGVAAVNKPTHINGTLDRTTSGCTACHGELGAPGVTLTASLVKAAPGGSGSGTNSYDTTGLASGNAVGAHKAHLVGSTGTPRWRSTVIACTECHALPPTDTDKTHATGAGTGGARATLTWGPLATVGSTPGYTQPTCSSVYCHNPNNADIGAGNKTPAWNGASTVAQCGTCHGLPPSTGGAHPAATECNSCHPGYKATMPVSTDGIAAVNAIAHMNGALDGGGDCTGCHAGSKSITKGPLAGSGRVRRAIVPEFTTAGNWSHKRSGGYTVTKFDCVVCHMEGDLVTGNTVAGVHMDGYVNLRDPDTGNNIEAVTFGGAGAGAYTSTAGANQVFDQFSRDLGNATLEPAVQAIMVNQCLKCHDADGAKAAFVPGGSATKPFATTILGTGYVAGGDISAGNVAGGVVNVNESFKVTNSSYHPVTGKQNNWYAKLTRMVAPWNAATRGAAADVTSWGPLLSCWDCHAPPTVTNPMTFTVTAHGVAAANYMRGSPQAPSPTVAPVLATNESTLCKACHALYTTTASSHGTGSAFTSGNSGMSPYLNYSCNTCHSSGWPTVAVRPVKAQDVHGVNVLPTGGLTKSVRWAGNSTGTPAQVNAKPYAFIRNTQQMTDHSPKVIGATTYTFNCNMAGTGISARNCSQGVKGYGVGGTY